MIVPGYSLLILNDPSLYPSQYGSLSIMTDLNSWYNRQAHNSSKLLVIAPWMDPSLVGTFSHLVRSSWHSTISGSVILMWCPWIIRYPQNYKSWSIEVCDRHVFPCRYMLAIRQSSYDPTTWKNMWYNSSNTNQWSATSRPYITKNPFWQPTMITGQWLSHPSEKHQLINQPSQSVRENVFKTTKFNIINHCNPPKTCLTTIKWSLDLATTQPFRALLTQPNQLVVVGWSTALSRLLVVVSHKPIFGQKRCQTFL